MADFSTQFLSPVGFSFQILRTPATNFFVQSVSLPGITTTSVEVPNPIKRIPVHGDHPVYDEFSVTFKINEDMSNYLEIFNWIRSFSTPDNYGEYESKYSDIYSDGTLLIMTSQMNPNIRIQITDMFPTSLTPVEMMTTDTGIEYVTATAQFRFQDYSFDLTT